MKNVIYTFLFLCFFTTNWANPLMEKANDLYKKEQYDQAIIAYEKILENNQLAKYENKWEIANMLKQAVKNGENSIIREKHIENIQKLKTRNRFY